MALSFRYLTADLSLYISVFSQVTCFHPHELDSVGYFQSFFFSFDKSPL